MIAVEEPRSRPVCVHNARRCPRACSWSRFLLVTVLASTVAAAASELEPVELDEPNVITSVIPLLPSKPKEVRRELPDGFLRAAPASIEELRAMEVRMRELVERVAPAVVALRIGGAHGSGVVISAEGMVLTAAHVSGEPGRLVRLTFPDGREARGRTLGANHDMDSGLIQITDTGPWPNVPMGDATGTRLGDWVLAFGHPGGFSAERPTVVRLGRVVGSDRELLRTDSTIISGDSGGPLIDMNGHVIGIHSRISTSLAANYHVPISTFGETWARLARGESWGGQESLRRSWVGARVADHPEGFRVERVFANGPAFLAGLEPGDIIVGMNGAPIKDAAAFMAALAPVPPGEVVVLDVRRADQEFLAELTVQTGPGRGERRGRR